MDSFRRIGRQWHFARHLTLPQFIHGLGFHAISPKPDLRPPPAVRARPGYWSAPVHRPPVLVGPTSFRLLNTERDLTDVGWDGGDIDALWRFNQHYFDDLCAEGAPARASWHHKLLLAWVRDNPPASGIGWSSHPTSLRIVNWIKWALSGHDLPDPCTHSLAVQTRWLARRLERHRLGNHLMANAKALIFAGSYFQGPEADQWRRIGLSVLSAQLPVQVLSDGGHYELSPMYHSIILEDLLDLVNLRSLNPWLSKNFPVALDQFISRMLDWLCAMTHPDGQIAFFNDAAIGVALDPASLTSYALGLGFRPTRRTFAACTLLGDSGYARLHVGDAVVILDVGRVGPDMCPGHCHADTLSFELSLFGQRCVVNAGVSQYGSGPTRDDQRSTASHNTVVVDGKNSSDVWGGFRVGRRARVHGIQLEDRVQSVALSAWHDGYRNLPGRPIHRRRWRLSAGVLEVVDEVDPAYPAMAHFLLSPNVSAASPGSKLLIAGRSVQFEVPEETRWKSGTWHPEFGVSIATRKLEVPLFAGRSRVLVRWS